MTCSRNDLKQHLPHYLFVANGLLKYTSYQRPRALAAVNTDATVRESYPEVMVPSSRH